MKTSERYPATFILRAPLPETESVYHGGIEYRNRISAESNHTNQLGKSDGI